MGTLAYALERIRGVILSPVKVVKPPDGIIRERDVLVRVRDGTALRVNVYRPSEAGRFPVLMSLHPYGKDMLPKRVFGRYQPLLTYRLLRQTGPVQHSAWTGWEAPDPAFWVPRGYVVVNADMRGFHRSDGQAHLLSQQEGEDYYDLIEWAGGQEWSSGKVGLLGVSYLALTQWRAAALHPPSLAAICPWEGFTDVYRDLAYPGGVREDGFVPFWFGRLDRRRVLENLRQDQLKHDRYDELWKSRTADLSAITVPALICGSFSDHNLHSGGSFRGYQKISSSQKWLYTHRNGKWAEFYSREGLDFQCRFFDHFLKEVDNGMDKTPPVRLEVRVDGKTVREVRDETQWPPARVRWVPLYLAADEQLHHDRKAEATSLTVDFPSGKLEWRYLFEKDTELTGPMSLLVEVSVDEVADLHLFVGIRKFRDGREVYFEGSYGFGKDMVTRGWARLSGRGETGERTTIVPGEVIPLAIEILPSSTYFETGDELRLEIGGRYPYLRHPLLGQFPAAYQPSPPGRLHLHLGNSHLLIPALG